MDASRRDQDDQNLPFPTKIGEKNSDAEQRTQQYIFEIDTINEEICFALHGQIRTKQAQLLP